MMPSTWVRCLISLGLLTVQVLVMRPSWWARWRLWGGEVLVVGCPGLTAELVDEVGE